MSEDAKGDINAKDYLSSMIEGMKLAGEMDGKEAARLIRQSHDIPVVFVSAFMDETVIDDGQLSVNKPFSPSDLAKAVEAALAR